MITIPQSDFGRDHWSLLAFIECRCVDHGGQPDFDRMRCNPKRHPALIGPKVNRFGNAKWQPEYGTRLNGHTEVAPKRVPQHDDHDCARDLEKAGLIEIHGTGINPVFQMTTKGTALVGAIRAHKQAGGSFSTFMV